MMFTTLPSADTSVQKIERMSVRSAAQPASAGTSLMRTVNEMLSVCKTAQSAPTHASLVHRMRGLERVAWGSTPALRRPSVLGSI